MVFFVLYSLFATAQVTATFKADSNHIEIGDHLNMRFVVSAKPGYMVGLPKFDRDSMGPNLEIIKRDKLDKAFLSGDSIYSQTITISAYDGGRYFISPIKVLYLNKATGTIDSTFTNDFELIVAAPPVDTTKPIKPIKAPLKVKYLLNEFTWWIVGLLIVLLLIALGIFLYLRYRNRPTPVAARPRPKDPPHIWATKELRKLDQDKLWQNDKVKEYHSRLTDILRLYLEYRFDYYAMEATTEEIMSRVYNYDVSMDAGARLRDILNLADFVKFAKMTPAPDQNTKSIQDAFAFVEMTKPIVEEVNPAAKK